MIRLIINGGCGKMGRRIIDLAAAEDGVKVAAALECNNHPELGRKIEGVLVSDNPDIVKDADVVIDFSSPEAAMELLKVILRHKKACVIGTTGFNPEQVREITKAAASVPIVFSPNMSVGVNVLFRLVREAAGKLKDYDISIKEVHHVHKKDSPSGTAKKIAEIAEKASNKKVKDIIAIREGEVIGEHEIVLESKLDKLVISHSAKTRDVLACGAIAAAKWVANKPAGLYDIQDVLG